MGRSRRVKSLLLLGIVVVMVNLPQLQSSLIQRRLERDGVDATVEVLEHEVSGSGAEARYLLSGRLPESVDEDESVVSATVQPGTYSQALLTGEATVRVLPDHPTTYRFAGAVPRSRLGLWVTLGVDAVLALAVLWIWRSRRAEDRDRLHMEATEDLTPIHRGWLVEGEDGHVEAAGQLLELDEHEALIDVGHREVVVVLDGHRCLVDVGDLAVARGRRLE